MQLKQVLIDTRGMSKPAQLSIDGPAIDETGPLGKLAIDGVQLMKITAASAPPLAAGNAMLLCIDPVHGPISLCVWYLTADQFLHYLKNGQLFAGAALLQRTSPWSFILVGGTMAPTPKGNGEKLYINSESNSYAVHWKAVQGARRDIQQLGITLVEMPQESDLGGYLLWLAESDRGPKRIPPQREALFATPAEAILTSIDGIGQETADKILVAAGGDLTLALNLMTDLSTPDIKGVPHKLREEVRKVFGLKDRETALGFAAPLEALPF